jgi:hypothetical protein
MARLFSIEALVTFIPESGGGRKTLPLLSLSDFSYRPHLVVGSPDQRRAIFRGNVSDETYIAVAFGCCQESIEFNQPFLAELGLMYYPHPIYDALVVGVTFTIREGAQVVGFGQVTRPVSSFT